MPIKLEVCVDNIQGLDAAADAGADRIELCASLDVGGLTPTYGLMAYAASLDIPVYAMIRPRLGPFVFDADDLKIMREDIRAAKRAGLAGVVLGGVTRDRRLDVEMTRWLVDAADGMGLTLNRSFDLVHDRDEALAQAIDLGFERILTSAGATTVTQALPELARLVRAAGDRISLMAGSGVRQDNVVDVIQQTGVHEVHGSFKAAKTSADDEFWRSYGYQHSVVIETNPTEIRQVRTAIDALG